MIRFIKIFGLAALLSACQGASPSGGDKAESAKTVECQISLTVLGAGQDAGAPQIGNPSDPGWQDPSKRLWATALGLVDHKAEKRYLFEATPDIREQLEFLDQAYPVGAKGLGIDGIFLTHAHIGHYAGLMFLGRESAGSSNVPVYVMPRMEEFLRKNGPWNQLVELGNIKLQPLTETAPYEISVNLSSDLNIMAFRVPHRDEYSETVGYIIQGPQKSALFLPDIDSWQAWEKLSGPEWEIETNDMVIKAVVDRVDYAFVDATFFDDNELPGRDMSKIPHPRVVQSMDLFSDRSETERAKIHFIHINHTNPLRDHTSSQYKDVISRGFNVAKRGDKFCL